MRLLISDANILIDVEVAGLTEVLFGLDHTFAVPDILYAEELAARHGRLIALGLEVMEPVPELSCGGSASGNPIVQGDNLHALKALLPRYAGQVKCIYIDPPYKRTMA